MMRKNVREGCDVLIGNCLKTLKMIPDESVHTCITSPPYYGLRDYGTGTWVGGDPDCSHQRDSKRSETTITGHKNMNEQGHVVGDGIFKSTCRKCGATREDEQIGLEDSPEEFIEKLVSVFREVKRVLHPSGTLWINIGDSYCGTGHKGDHTDPKHKEGRNGQVIAKNNKLSGYKSKDLIGIPWMLAFALRADGWYLRQDIIWSKPNCMPESVKDRCTKSHEYIFLLSKSKKYFYDSEAIKEPVKQDWGTRVRTNGKYHNEGTGLQPHSGLEKSYETKNKRSVWNVSPKPYSEAHFAVFPPELIEPCVLAGTSQGGCCSTCFAPYVRTTGRPCQQCGEIIPTQGKECKACGFRNTEWMNEREINAQKRGVIGGGHRHTARKKNMTTATVASNRYLPSCDCDAEQIPCTVLDPFGGSGTTAGVALKHHRNAILCELNEEYTELINNRIESITKTKKGQKTLFATW
jgi:DNA modification methylase